MYKLANGEVQSPKTHEEAPIRIVCSAMRNKDGLVVCSVRHYDSFIHQFNVKIDNLNNVREQGFVDNRFNYLTREEAWVVAFNAGQIIRRCGGDMVDGVGRLYSENLY